AFQPGPVIDTLEGELTMAVVHRDPGAGQEAIWTQHTVDPGDGSVVMRWYEVIPATRSRRQQGTVSDSSHDIFNGAISPGTSGDFAGLDYNRSGTDLPPEIRARVHGPTTPPGGSV